MAGGRECVRTEPSTRHNKHLSSITPQFISECKCAKFKNEKAVRVHNGRKRKREGARARQAGYTVRR